MTQLLDKQQAYLQERLGATHFTRPLLSLIPLGVHSADFTPDAAARHKARAELGIADDEVVYLFVGRLSFHAKANPLPMYLALEAASKLSRKKLVLIQAGWFANDKIEAAFRQGAAALCPSVRAIFLDGRVATQREQAWQCADVFTSLSDNIQETYGLTPVEGMAAGLPCVVSDWDGYRDTVRDGIDGMMIPTYMPAPGFGADLAARHEDEVDNYDRYIGSASLFVAVDIRATAQAYAKLAGDADLRATMGRSGRARALRDFDWSVILKRYDGLWRELGLLRAGGHAAQTPRSHPTREDPYSLFACYPTRPLQAQDRLQRMVETPGASLRRLQSLAIAWFAEELLPNREQGEALLLRIPLGASATLEQVLQPYTAAERALAYRWVLWMAKCGLLEIHSAQQA